MRRIIFAFLLSLFFAGLGQAAPARASSLAWVEGGITNEKDYREILFLTGEPVQFTGTVTVTVTEGRDGTATERVSYNLENKERLARLTRSVTFSSTVETRLQQKVTVSKVNQISETVTIGKDRYALQDYQFAYTALTDPRPAVSYTMGNWNSRKMYNVNGGTAALVVDSVGSNSFYQHAWGSSEKIRLDSTISFSGDVTVNKAVYATQWAGTFGVNTGLNDKRWLAYQESESARIGFPASYIETNQSVDQLKFTYNMPRLDQGLPVENRRNQGSGVSELRTLPVQKRLPVPSLRDVRGHWAEGDIMSLLSLSVFNSGSEYFGPNLPMTRGEFARALVQVNGLPLPEPPAPPRSSRTTALKEESLFADVPVTDGSYRFYQAVALAGIMKGTGPALFSPDSYLTRGQAVTIIIRALGLEKIAPSSPYKTGFVDDDAIPAWARDAMFAGAQIGIIRGDDNGYARPGEVMTKAAAAAFVNRYIQYLQKEM